MVFSAPLEQPMIFPAVTVCNLNAYRKDDLEAIGFCIPAEMYDEVNVTSIWKFMGACDETILINMASKKKTEDALHT